MSFVTSTRALCRHFLILPRPRAACRCWLTVSRSEEGIKEEAGLWAGLGGPGSAVWCGMSHGMTCRAGVWRTRPSPEVLPPPGREPGAGTAPGPELEVLRSDKGERHEGRSFYSLKPVTKMAACPGPRTSSSRLSRRPEPPPKAPLHGQC